MIPEKKSFDSSVCMESLLGGKSDLLKHERTHANERPFPCSQCGDSFKRLEHLKMQNMKHIG